MSEPWKSKICPILTASSPRSPDGTIQATPCAGPSCEFFVLVGPVEGRCGIPLLSITQNSLGNALAQIIGGLVENAASGPPKPIIKTSH